jgi:O-antigen/teichoic acid export membrane protein
VSLSQPEMSPGAQDATRVSLNASGRAVARNALSGYLTLALGALLGFLLTPVLLHKLGDVGFGTWALILGAVNYLALLEAGLGFATITRTAASESEGPKALSSLLSSSLALLVAVAALGAVVSTGFSFVFPLLFHVPGHLAGEARLGMLLIGLWQCISFVASVYSACLLGTGRMYLVNLKGFLVVALVSVAQIAVLLLGGGIEEIALVQVVGGFATWAVFRREVARHLPGLRISIRSADRRVARRLLSLGWRNSVTSVANLFAFGSDILLVGLLLNPASAAAFAVALRGYTLLQRLSTGVNGSIGPAHAHAAKHGSPERRFDLYCKGLTVSLVLALIAAFTVGAYAEPLLKLWLGDVPLNSPTVLILLCAVLALQMPGLHAYTLLLNAEKASELMRVVSLAAATNVVGSVVFTLAFGTIGPALGSLVAVIIFDAAYLPRRVCSMLDQPYVELAKRVFVPLVPPLLALVTVLGLGRTLVPEGPAVLGVLLLGAAVFTAAWWPTGNARDLQRVLRLERSHILGSSGAPPSGEAPGVS